MVFLKNAEKINHFPTILFFFFQKSIAITLLSKVPPCRIILVQDRLSNFNRWKPTTSAFQNTLTFDRYLFNSRSNFHVNLVHLNSMHPKKVIYLLFSVQTPHFLGENHKTRTNKLHHWKAGFLAVILSLRIGVQYMQKIGEIILSTRWQ